MIRIGGAYPKEKRTLIFKNVQNKGFSAKASLERGRIFPSSPVPTLVL